MLKYMYITNRPDVARLCEEVGVDRVFVDMEWMGKAERQGHIDSVKSFHTLEDVADVRDALTCSELLVRVNPIHGGTRKEVAGAIAAGADCVMLPMARTYDEVCLFTDAVAGKAKAILLLETRGAEDALEAILDNSGIDEIHIGINDLSLDYGIPFMFTLLANGTVERICSRIRPYGIPDGFGGVARIGGGRVPTENVLMEHRRLGSTRAILSRSFYNVDAMQHIDEAREVFSVEFARIREVEAAFAHCSGQEFLENMRKLKELCR